MSTYKIIIVGSSSVGKTSLCHKIQNREFNDEMPITIGVDFMTLKLTDYDKFTQYEDIYNIQLWDTAGHEKFCAITKAYYRNSNIILLCFDLTSRGSFIELNKWMKDIKSIIEEPVYICLMGLKSDLEPIITDKEITEFLNKHLITTFYRYSSKKAKNKKTIEAILINAIKKYELLIEDMTYARELTTSKFKLDNAIINPLITTEDTRLDNIKYCC